MRVKKVLMAVLGLCRETVVVAWELRDDVGTQVGDLDCKEQVLE